MTAEDQFRVREVRLCSCGKPADHISVCNRDRSGRDGDDEAERIDRVAEERMARQQEERHAGRRRRFDAERRERRTRMTTLALLAEATQRSARLSTVKASNPEPMLIRGGGGDGPSGPPRQQSLNDDPRWEDATRIVRKRVMQMLDLIDEAEGTGHGQVVAAMDGTEKDRLLLDEGRGLVAEQVVAELGPEYGSASYVRKLRRARGLDNRGYPKAEA